ncbi:hypothetical protein C8R44DRAFT_984786 [Mycena epipterygia]|nr:hypothetical protein C8R44DRAFT_984786 [Mycena epipterygia]
MPGRDARPSVKRRRLNPSQPIITVTHPSPQKQPAKPAAAGPGICTSCHRAAPGLLLLCARCASPTCAICSRTCTACMPSQPPTPHLTWSPTPSPAHSPRRLALALNAANTNHANASAGAGASKRKKLKDDGEEERAEEDADAGCGRTVCRECCFETPQESTTTCYDCYGG